MSFSAGKRLVRLRAARPHIHKVVYLLTFQITIAALIAQTPLNGSAWTWWFIALVALSPAAAAYFAYYYRSSNMVALEQVRTGLASDLHDEIGSGLTEIAILAELVRQGKTVAHVDPLAHVSESARNLRDSMSDIVWALDPRCDRAGDLISRMRQSAVLLLELNNCDVRFEWTSGQELAVLEITPDHRRHILLIYKEALVNIARHSGATSARIQVGIDREKFWFSIADNGRGFDSESIFEGHGLRSIRLRADRICGQLEINSNSGGTLVRLSSPVRGAPRMNMRLKSGRRD